MAGAAIYDVRHFSINTDVERLISQDLPWHERQVALTQAFPQKGTLCGYHRADPRKRRAGDKSTRAGIGQGIPSSSPRSRNPTAGIFSTATDCC